MKLKKLRLQDKSLFVRFLNLRGQGKELSVFAFANIYIWKKLYDIRWIVIGECLCVFFIDRIGAFLYLPPLGRQISRKSVDPAFRIMDSFNSNKEISRIENIEEADIALFKELGYACEYKSSDYVCSRISLAGLSGDKFKPKRAAYNYFVKHYKYEYLPFSPRYKAGCLELFRLWQEQRAGASSDKIYRGMIEDSLGCLKILFAACRKLDITGRIVRVEGKIKAFSFGYRLNRETFCILYEITDLSIKGIAQFIFREFCSELKKFRYINIMDDSGLENLKKVKLSYRPVKLVPAYIARRHK
ncbi:MAG: phosphatidylglycerol lysyltransferase domain-containing protein [Candidatus Omnitrophota bacterium]